MDTLPFSTEQLSQLQEVCIDESRVQHRPPTLNKMAGETILVVEDERSIVRSLEYGLQAEGFSVLPAKTGGLTRTLDPHLILPDMRLPDINGFDVCRPT